MDNFFDALLALLYGASMSAAYLFIVVGIGLALMILFFVAALLVVLALLLCYY
jgi:hypothetical protein